MDKKMGTQKNYILFPQPERLVTGESGWNLGGGAASVWVKPLAVLPSRGGHLKKL